MASRISIDTNHSASRTAARWCATAIALAALLVIGIRPAWSLPIFTNTPSYTSSYGAGTKLEMNTCGYVIGASCLSEQKQTTSGNDGQASTKNSGSLLYGTASTSDFGRADAGNAKLGGSVSVTGQGTPGSGTGGSGTAISEFYNTYTLNGPSGLTPTINVGWFLDGTFSTKTSGENPGSAKLEVKLYPVPTGISGDLIVEQVVSSSQCAICDLSGSFDLSSRYKTLTGKTLTVGDSFLLDTILDVTAGTPSLINPIGTFTADFYKTGGFTLSSSDPNVTIAPAVGPSTPVPEPGTLYLTCLGAAVLVRQLRRT